MALYACGDSDKTPDRVLVALEMVPVITELPKGLTHSYRVVGIYSDEHRADLSAFVRWQSSAPEVASVDTTGLVRARAEGSTVIVVAHEESGVMLQAQADLRVTPAVVQSITIGPEPAVTGVGLPLALKATATYSDGSTADAIALANWASESPEVVAVEPTTGISTGVALGRGTIRGTIAAVAATVTVAIVSGTWTPGGEAPRSPGNATVLSDGRVLTVSGSGFQSTLIFDPPSRSWSVVDSYLDCPSCAPGTQTLLADGWVLGTGGMSSDLGLRSFNTAKRLDPTSGHWTRMAGMQQRRSGHAAIRLANDAVLVVGGTEDFDPRAVVPKTAEVFDPTHATWSWTGNFSGGEGPLFLLPNGKVLKIGASETELYDPSTGTWTLSGGSSNTGAALTLLRDGRVLRTGGRTNGAGTLATSDLYDPATGVWTSTGSMAWHRQGHAATLLADGRVMVSGGSDGTKALASTEFYDPSSGTWSSGPALATARWGHSARLLPSGMVVVLGGNGGPPTTSLKSIELYW